MSFNKIRLGVVGCGVIGKQHLKGAQEADWVELAGIADINPEAARQAAEQFGTSKVFPTAEQMLEDPEIDAVVLALPTPIRFPLALQALACGKHILLEKPNAMNEGQIRELMARQGDRTIAFCSSRFHYLEHAKAARKWIEEGNLGEIRLLRCRVNQPAGKRPTVPPPAWRLKKANNGGGVLANWGNYDIDYLLGLTGWSLKPEWISGQIWEIPEPITGYFPEGSDSETHGTAWIRFEGGAVFTYERGEFMSAPFEQAWQIIGSKGTLSLQVVLPAEKVILGTTLDPESGAITSSVWEGTDDISWVEKGPVFDFTRAILEGRSPVTGLQEALVLQQITDAIYKSAETGSPVDIRNERSGYQP